VRSSVHNGRDTAALREPNFGELLGAPKRPRRSLEAPRASRKSAGPEGGMSRLRMADILAGFVAAAAVLLVFVNALSLQRASHPMPAVRPAAAAPVHKKILPAPLPPARPESTKPRSANALMLDIQRELAERGFYNGAVDGIAGPRAIQAIREFEKKNGLKVTGEPSENLLEKIRHSLQKSDITGSIAPAAKPILGSRIGSVQRVLARYGFGPVRINGEMDAETHAAIRRFEREQNLPASGEVSARLEQELAAYSGSVPD
jgi:peptidoglycan hydrolase-like protein with peptidoglycan-binding domain